MNQSMTREQKDDIDRLVNIWISGIQSSNKDAGWEGDSLMARLIEYGGQPPGPTGNDQSNVAMINSIRLLRGQHAEFPFIAAAMFMLLRFQQTRDLALAISARHYYQGLCPWTDRAWTDANRAAKVNMTPSQFRWCLDRAYPAIESELERVRMYSRYIA